MASIHGDWFHSRSSSNYGELLTVRTLVRASEKPEYQNFRWSGGRDDNPLMRQFSRTGDIQPSTMQTKIRAMIRYGFIRDGNTCPLTWTRIGSLWNELHEIGNSVAAKKIYELTLSISLAIYAFNDSQQKYTINPAKGELPLRFLLNRLDNNSAISLQEFTNLVDGKTNRVGDNASYWKTDLINSGLFHESDEHLVYTGNYAELANELRNFTPDVSLEDEDWQRIRENPLIEISPFRNTIKNIFREMTQGQAIENSTTNEIYTDPLIGAISEQEETALPELDILSENPRFANNTRRIRNATWAIRIKKKYNYICAVPKCDVIGEIFVESAHIKPDSVADEGTPHRSHMLNGICLCRHCHVAFDRGYFSLADDHRVITSQRIDDIANQNLKTAIQSSSGDIIKNRSDNKMPLLEFIHYHRANKFMGQANVR